MNVIIVAGHIPRQFTGAATRNYYLLRALARRHTVTVLAIADQRDADTYLQRARDDRSGHAIHVFARAVPPSKRLRQLTTLARGGAYMLATNSLPAVQQALDRLVQAGEVDAVIFEGVQVANYRVPAHIPVLIDEHNIEHELLQRTYQSTPPGSRKVYAWLESRRVKRAEIQRCQAATAVLVTSERERAGLRRLVPRTPIEVVPNGVDVEFFNRDARDTSDAKRSGAVPRATGADASASAGGAAPHEIIFTGTLDYFPNVNGALFFGQQCWPLIRAQVPDATWTIVGRSPAPEVVELSRLPGVTVTGSVADVRPYLRSAAIAIAPLHIGAGTRLKILEALAMRTATVATSIGCEGIAVVSGEHLVVADDPTRFAQAVVDLLRDPARRAALGANGRALVEARYSWDQCADALLHVLERIGRREEAVEC